MDEDKFNISVRKFLKEVGVTSQRVIETAVRDALKAGTIQSHQTLKATMTLEIGSPPVRHVVEGDVELG
jgi:hypothetical protein